MFSSASALVHASLMASGFVHFVDQMLVIVLSYTDLMLIKRCTPNPTLQTKIDSLVLQVSLARAWCRLWTSPC